MKNKELLVFEKLDELLTRHPNKTQARTHLLILLNHTIHTHKNIHENIDIKLSKQDILDKEFKDDPNNSKSYDTGRVVPDKIEMELKRVIFNNNQIIDDFFKVGYIPTFKKHQSEGGRNNPSYYWLEIKQIDSHNVTETQNNIHKIKYEHRDKSLVKISLFAKIFFDKNHELKMMSFKGVLLLLILINSFFIDLIIIALLFVSIFAIYDFLKIVSIIMPALIFLFLFISLCTLYTFYIPLNKIVINRIVKAPFPFKSFHQDNAEIEFFGKEKGYKYNIARITEIRSVCPICTAPILLMDGKPDQSAPLVGRCIEAPHAHVYSFDRMLMIGYFLGHPTYLQENQDSES